MKKKKVKKNRIISAKHIFLLIFLIAIVCLMIHPIQLLKNNLFKPISVAAGANNSRPARYSESDIEKTTYVDGSGKEYYIEFVQNLPEEVLLSYEDIIQHKAEIVNVKRDSYEDSEMKDLFIAEMKSVISSDYIDRYKRKLQYMDEAYGADKVLIAPDELSEDILEIAKEDATITPNESTSLRELWQVLELTDPEFRIERNSYDKRILIYYNRTINTEEEIIGKNTQSLFDVGKVYANTRTLNLYKRNPNLLTVENGGITAAEAYIMASTRDQSTSWDTDRMQQALWVINDKGLEIGSIDDIPNVYKGLNPESNVISTNNEAEADALDQHIKELEKFKKEHIVDNLETEMYDNMLDIYDTKNKKNYYESGMAGLVGYDETQDEYLVGPFSIDYVRTVFDPLEGGQNQNQNDEGIIIFNSIIDAEVYGLNSAGEEVKLNDWEFVYTDLEKDDNDIDNDEDKSEYIRVEMRKAYDNKDTTPNVYPYPNENFYIRFNDPTVLAITKLEFKMRSMNAEAEVYLYEGKTYDVSWVGATDGKENYLQMTPSWEEIRNGEANGIDVADLYQVKSARLVNEEKTITLSVGNYHELSHGNYYELAEGAEYKGYCIPITMELGGMVWYDGTEVEEVQDSDKEFGERDRNDKNQYSEAGMADIYVHLYDENNNKIKDDVTDKNGDYLFTYVKLGPKYYIEFEYDGMRYKATKYLNGDPNNENYTNSNEFLNYLEYSHAKEDVAERTEYNNSFTEIKNGNTRTSGQAVSNTGAIKDIEYTTQSYDGSNASYTGGTADINRYNFKTSTKTTQLIYPLQNSYMITGKYISDTDKNQNHLVELGIPNIFVLGTVNLATNENHAITTKQGEANAELGDKENDFTEKTINYTMVDTYLHHINLGLVERAPIDFAIKNDVVKATLTFLDDKPKGTILGLGTRPTDAKTFDITSREGDYFSQQYTYDVEGNTYKWRYNFTDSSQSLPTDQAQVYVEYKMTIINQAEVTSGYITELVNYYENSLYYPVDTNESWRYYSWGYQDSEPKIDPDKNYVDGNGEEGYGNLIIPQVAPKTSWAVKNAGTNKEEDLGQVKWNSNSKFGSSNNKNYSNNNLNTMYTNSLSNVILEPGETIEIYVIYKVDAKPNASIGSGEYLVNDNTGLGKRNIVEINAYKALNIDGTNGGRVDKDSAPGNIELENYITYEDDVDSAPYFRLTWNELSKGNTIEGRVWDDSLQLSEDGISELGNGKIDINPDTNQSTENYVNNVIVELVRLELNQKTGEYEEVSFTDEFREIYPEYYTWTYPYEDKTLQDILATSPNAILSWTGPNHNNGSATRPLNEGQYRFENLVGGGKYKIRFIYGTEAELRAESLNLMNVGQANSKLHSGHDYKSTQYSGRIDLSKIVMPQTDIMFIVDSYEMIKGINTSDSIINILKNINSNLSSAMGLENYRNQLNVDILSFGGENIREIENTNFDEIKSGSAGDTPFSATEAIYVAGLRLRESSAQNKIVIIYNDGSDSKLEDTKVQIAQLLNDGVTVIGIGRGTESLDIYRTSASANDNEVQVYTLNDNDVSNMYTQNNIYDSIINLIIDNYYFKNDTSHAEDLLQNEKYYTMQGNERNVTGRLEVMQFSQNMDAETADVLNVEYINTLTKDTNSESAWSKAIKELASKTQMTADSYVVSFEGVYDAIKNLNLGLQEIPERDVEITNEVDSIVVRLSTGRPLVSWQYGQNVPAENVQEIKNELFSIYMDKEIMQGATIEVTYRIHVSNIGEVDKLINYVKYATPEEQRNWYNALTGENIQLEELDAKLSETVPIRITKLYSYYDNLVFRAQDNNRWEIVNQNVKENSDSMDGLQRDQFGHLEFTKEENNNNNFGNENISTDRDARVIWTEVDTTDEDNLEILDRNKERIQNYRVVETTSLKDIELYPNKSDEVVDGQAYSTVGTYLVLSKTLSAEDMQAEDALSYRNYVEIISTASDTGRRDYNGAEGNFTGDGTLDNLTSENDIDAAERVIILPPFGENKIIIGIIIAAIVILGVGVIFIKKKVV